jgi:hypothetical protein
VCLNERRRHASFAGAADGVVRRTVTLLEGCKVSAAEQLTLFAPPPFAPAWPGRGTLAAHALTKLMMGRQLDHPTFEAATGSWRLAAVVFELRAMGWPVESIEAPSPTEQCPSRAIAVYRITATGMAAARGGSAP